jgi:2-C-methyl-D-erythritol 4-phosphate cytidylyltransferase/2-C-methyl-D-erythritol 2,4-cyclodiphosphate synthase
MAYIKSMSSKKITTIILAAGSGVRAGFETPKQYLTLAGKSILRHSIEGFLQYGDVQVVIRKGDEDLYKKATHGLTLKPVIYGGQSRQQSVFNALKYVKDDASDIVLIHDAARPFASKKVIENIIAALEHNRAAIPAIPVKDTLKLNKAGLVEKNISRHNLYQVQTPQGFYFEDIFKAHEKFQTQNFTDDANLIEAMGGHVFLSEGEEDNFKITTKYDYERAKIMTEKPSFRVGQGFDVHAFETSNASQNNVIICGVKIPHEFKLVGHSDADVGLHALVDAILGAVGRGDIGEHFPPSDEKWRGADSSLFLIRALEIMVEEGFEIANIDLTIICEAPKITPHKDAMRKHIAAIAKIDISKVNVKATTTEKLGFTGRKEGIAAQAVVTVIKTF